MLKYFSLIAFVGLFIGCSQSNPDKIKSELLDLDKNWSELSQKNGYNHTRIDFAEDSAIEIEEGKMPEVGMKAFKEDIKNHPDSNFCLGWIPLRAEVSSSGDLGYTFGGFAFKTKTKAGVDTTYYGDYVTVWHKQPDGKWKFVLDGGTDTPHPVVDLK